MAHSELIPHLFRHEFSKITAVLCKYMGVGNLDLAENIASETFLRAMETWPYKGIPPNPTAWLYTVAKNKAKNAIHRSQLFEKKIAPAVKQASEISADLEIDLTDSNISDSQLKMMFAICHPTLSTEAQICLSLRILCGFGVEEIATAFLTNKERIIKRIFRAKEKLRQAQIPIQFPAASEIGNRLETVLTTIYLLFNEGYYSESQDAVLREDLCLEAMRLAHLLTENEQTNLSEVQALLALMCFHASRFPARKTANGEIILYEDQDERLWNQALIARGAHYLHQASQGARLSKYHLEAGIAYWNTNKADSPEKWENILQLYNRLLQLQYSPIAALNRTFALSKARSKQEAIAAAEKLQLIDNPFYFSLLGELYKEIDPEESRRNFQKARALARTTSDKETISKKLEELSDICRARR